MDHLDYTELKTQSYLIDDRIDSFTAKQLFKLRTRMVDVHDNFKSNFFFDKVCPVCKIGNDDQRHLLECIKIKQINPTLNVKRTYMDIFSNDSLKVYEVGYILIKSLETRKGILTTK